MLQILVPIVFMSVVLVDGIQQHPKLEDVFPTRQLDVGAKFRFMCMVLDGEKPLTFAWYKDGQPQIDGHGLVINTRVDDSELILPKISTTDAGKYTCIASNRFGEDAKSSTLMVKGW